MDEDNRADWESLVRAHELCTGRTLTAEESERGFQRFLERRRKLEAFAWMIPFMSRQGSKSPNLRELYRRKAELDGEA
jgi:hypothetical protein